jgi:cobyrinic acid a,c-diamide synthase
VTVRVLLISAIASGQGKTTVTAALARKLTRMGQRVRVFKVGADFIDPLMLERAGGAFAHLYGTHQLLPESQRALIRGFVRVPARA